jgi:hypothetical protein
MKLIEYLSSSGFADQGDVSLAIIHIENQQSDESSPLIPKPGTSIHSSFRPHFPASFSVAFLWKLILIIP